MVAPLLITGARVIFSAAAKQGVKKGIRSTARKSTNGVAHARAVSPAAQTRHMRHVLRTTRTIDEEWREQQADLANNSITQSVRIRRQRKKNRKLYEEGAIQNTQPSAQSSVNNVSSSRAPSKLRSFAGNTLHTNSRIHKNVYFLIIYYTTIVLAYKTFLFLWFLQFIGFMLMLGTGYLNTNNIPLDIATVGIATAIAATGFIFFMFYYVLSTLVVVGINIYIIRKKRLSVSTGLIWLALSVLPLVHIVTLGVWFSRGKT